MDIQAQYAPLRDRIDAAIKDVLDTGAFILGPQVRALESDLATRLAGRPCVGVANGTDALIIALQSLDVGPGLQCALLGDLLGEKAAANGWSGVIVNGCVRDTRRLGQLPLGVMALAAHPRRSEKRGHGEREVAVRFAGVTFHPGDHVYADEDGVIVSASAYMLVTLSCTEQISA